MTRSLASAAAFALCMVLSLSSPLRAQGEGSVPGTSRVALVDGSSSGQEQPAGVAPAAAVVPATDAGLAPSSAAPAWAAWWLAPLVSVVALALSGAAIALALRGRGKHGSSQGSHGGLAQLPVAALPSTGKQGATATPHDDKMRLRIEDIEASVKRLHAAMASRETPPEPRTGPVAPIQDAPISTQGTRPSPPKSDEQVVADAFARWVRKGGGLVGRALVFQNELREALPQALVTPVYRDAKAPTLVFSTDAPPNPVEYWLVRTDKHVFLLPQALSAQQFREVDDRCFGGKTPAPSAVARVRPAVMAESGPGSVTLQRAGEIA